jgi:hypothetical protein
VADTKAPTLRLGGQAHSQKKAPLVQRGNQRGEVHMSDMPETAGSGIIGLAVARVTLAVRHSSDSAARARPLARGGARF